MWYIYVLLCYDNSFYCGITTNLERRLKQHNGMLKGGAKYTRGRRPCQVIYTFYFGANVPRTQRPGIDQTPQS